ncbi:MAG: hypothetical protein GOMPHAMPRED_001163 [Gomphillus americanus]|uniref:Uncharacterized protein n=1 Tax=Gomphillus americanus TaxID=1940652 RepID=A0A8H3IKG1_9LECA|nr:MAG: hypothetical protein GOMPHAMPRED_001163 [Gomphillus americanus]
MSRPGKSSPRSKIIRSTTASPLLSPTGPPCRKSSSPVDTNQASAMLSRFTSRSKSQSDDGSEMGTSEGADYFLAKPHEYFTAEAKPEDMQKMKQTTHGMCGPALNLWSAEFDDFF